MPPAYVYSFLFFWRDFFALDVTLVFIRVSGATFFIWRDLFLFGATWVRLLFIWPGLFLFGTTFFLFCVTLFIQRDFFSSYWEQSLSYRPLRKIP